MIWKSRYWSINLQTIFIRLTLGCNCGKFKRHVLNGHNTVKIFRAVARNFTNLQQIHSMHNLAFNSDISDLFEYWKSDILWLLQNATWRSKYYCYSFSLPIQLPLEQVQTSFQVGKCPFLLPDPLFSLSEINLNCQANDQLMANYLRHKHWADLNFRSSGLGPIYTP